MHSGMPLLQLLLHLLHLLWVQALHTALLHAGHATCLHLRGHLLLSAYHGRLMLLHRELLLRVVLH